MKKAGRAPAGPRTEMGGRRATVHPTPGGRRSESVAGAEAADHQSAIPANGVPAAGGRLMQQRTCTSQLHAYETELPLSYAGRDVPYT